MTIVVTGAHGQLGGELCRQLGGLATPFDVDSLDLTNAAAVERVLLALRPRAVINCAAYTQVDRAETELVQCWQVNATAVEHLAAVCSKLDCPLVQISTDYVFGGQPQRLTPWLETDSPEPYGVYARSKLAAEQAAASYSHHLVVRTCGLYARREDERAKNFVKTMLRLGATHGEVAVVDDQHCTPTFVPHLAQAVIFLAGLAGQAPAPWGIYHVTNRGATTWCQFAREIFHHAKVDVKVRPITTAEYAAPAPRPAYSVLDTARYHSLGGPQMPHWQDALAHYFREMI